MTIATLCYLSDRSTRRVLLGKKKSGGAKGKANGFGGKVEATDTSIQAAAEREFLEETGVQLISPTLSSLLLFHFPDTQLPVYVYTCDAWTGEPHETDEMEVAWYGADALPIDAMWAGDRVWLPIALQHPGTVFHLYYEAGNDAPSRVDIRFGQHLDEGLHEALFTNA